MDSYEVPTAIVIDDDRLTVQVLCDYLETIDVKILARGHDGNEAVQLYKEHKPDIVFLDLIMPKYDGIFALREIRKTDPNSTVVVVTSDLRKETGEKLDELKPTAVIYKPFAVNSIANIVKKIKAKKNRLGIILNKKLVRFFTY